MRKLEMSSGVEEVFEAYMWNFRLIKMLWKINLLQKWTKNYKISLSFGFRFFKIFKKKKHNEIEDAMLLSLILFLFFPSGNHYYEFGIHSIHTLTLCFYICIKYYAIILTYQNVSIVHNIQKFAF